MSGNPFKKVSSGDKRVIHAKAWNAMLDVVAANARMGSLEPGDASAVLPPGIILIENDSGADVDRFGVLGISGSVFTPSNNANDFKSRVVLTGDSADETLYLGVFAIAAEPIS